MPTTTVATCYPLPFRMDSLRQRPCLTLTFLSAPPLVPFCSVSGGRPMCHVHYLGRLASGEGGKAQGGPFGFVVVTFICIEGEIGVRHHGT